jgi:hypothetical protein
MSLSITKNESFKPISKNEEMFCSCLGEHFGVPKDENGFHILHSDEFKTIFYNPIQDSEEAIKLLDFFKLTIGPNSKDKTGQGKWLAIVNGKHAIPAPFPQLAIVAAAYAIISNQIVEDTIITQDKKIILPS